MPHFTRFQMPKMYKNILKIADLQVHNALHRDALTDWLFSEWLTSIFWSQHPPGFQCGYQWPQSLVHQVSLWGVPGPLSSPPNICTHSHTTSLVLESLQFQLAWIPHQ